MRKRGKAGGPRRREREEAPLREYEIAVPFDAANEQVILGAMMVDEESCDVIRPRAPVEAFQVEDHKIIRDAIEEARRQKLGLDPATLVRLRPAIDVRVVEDLMAARPDGTPNLEFHMRTLLGDWVRAQATRGPIQSLVDLVQDPQADMTRLRSVARQVADAFAMDGGDLLLSDKRDVLRRMREKLEKRAAGEAWYPYGIPGLDHDEAGKRRHRPGTAPGMISVLTARSGGGKSTVAGHIIRGQARERRKTLVGAWEIEDAMTLELLATMELGWSRSRTLDGRTNSVRDGEEGDADPLTAGEIDELHAAGERIMEHVTFLKNPYQRRRRAKKTTNEDHIDALVENIKASGAEVVILDLYDRMLDDRSPDAEQSAIFDLVEAVADLQVHLILVHQQLLKGKDVRADKRPSIEGLKGSSAITDGASLILAPTIPALIKNVPDNTFEIAALKGRWCPPFAVEFDWDPDTGQLTGGRTLKKDEMMEDTDEAFGIGPRARAGGGGDRPAPSRGFNAKPRGRRS